MISAPNPKVRCGTCAYFNVQHQQAELGPCLRFPPTEFSKLDLVPKFPQTHRDACCGEWSSTAPWTLLPDLHHAPPLPQQRFARKVEGGMLIAREERAIADRRRVTDLPPNAIGMRRSGFDRRGKK